MREFPDQVAVEEENRSMTFSELMQNTYAICDHLIEVGISAGQIIPILFDTSVDMVMTVLVIMEAGAAYCPIDSEDPYLRIRQPVRDVKAKVIIGDQVI
ncbi:amino acid adenylation domain-containing [Fusarium sporotrichioides]|uniref:Amino acid adenylation domain-containing n=1 Tax=Fusarium sporotrichioides TaxID=5514 RepID=A0A395S2W5_FUSSP|nr:amino acid adenylation domain-containing [Fusarium sporotrichioides]